MAGGFEVLAAKEPPNPSKTGLGGFEYLAAKEGPPEDSWYKNLGRKAYQVVGGIINATPIPLAADFASMAATGESLGELEELEERLPELQEKFPFANVPSKIDREKYMQALQEAQGSFPTQRNIERGVEELTGAPLTPKTRADELLRLGGMAGKFGGVAAGIAAPAASATFHEGLGVPEPIADIAALALSNPLGKAYDMAPRIGKAKKASGLTSRRYEGLKKPKEVSGNVIKRIADKTESEFRDISSKLIQEGEGAKTYNALKEDSGFKDKVGDAFKQVEQAATEITEPLSTQGIKDKLTKASTGMSKKGFAANPFDKAYKSYITDMIKDIEAGEVTAQQLVQQYRKNNQALGDYYSPSLSRAQNRAQKDALLDFNRAIASTIKEEFPNSDFANLFEFTNKQWAGIKDAEAIDKFMDDMFSGKINYAKGKQFFERENMQIPFKRVLGEEGYEKFTVLMDDLMSTEQASKLLKVAEKSGLGDYAKHAARYVIHPSFAKGKLLVDTVKKAWDSLLDMPQLTVKWKKGIDQFKLGKFSDANKTFEDLEQDVEKASRERFEKRKQEHKKSIK
jgi:hypothetical protein